jgi:hypothetical protein
VRAFRRGSLVSGGTAALLIALGCGQSSKGKSTQAAAGKSTQQSSAGTSIPRPAVPSTPGATGTITGSSGGVTASLHAGTHHPKVGRRWPIRFTVTRGSHAARASVSYEYLFAGQVVARRSHYTFTGRLSDAFIWPSSAVGYPLTFRAVIACGGMTIDLDYPVQVVT